MNDLIKELIKGRKITLERGNFTVFLKELGSLTEQYKFDIDYSEDGFVTIQKNVA